jgi:hypothetical protein
VVVIWLRRAAVKWVHASCGWWGGFVGLVVEYVEELRRVVA